MPSAYANVSARLVRARLARTRCVPLGAAELRHRPVSGLLSPLSLCATDRRQRGRQRLTRAGP
jgi:hypothetical protein